MRTLAAVLVLGWVASCARGDASDAPRSAGVTARVEAPGIGDLPGPSAESDRLFDDDAPLRTYRIEVVPEDWAWLKAHAVEETYVPARIVFEGTTWEGASVRFKGSYGSLFSCFDAEGKQTCPKLSLKVSFNEVDKAGRFLGLRKLVFNSCNRDPSCLHERMAYATFRDAGVPAPRAVHARVQVNDEPASLFLLVEDVDKEFLKRRFSDAGGNLYKEAWPFALDAAAYIPALDTNEDEADVSRLVAFAGDVRSAPLGGWDAAVAPWIDRDAWSRALAVTRLVADADGITIFYCSPGASGRADCGNHNVYLYDDPTTKRFVLIPWDHDGSFGAPDTDLGRSWWNDAPDACTVRSPAGWFGLLAPQCDPLLHGLMIDHWDEYVALLDAFTAPGGILSVESQVARLDRYRAQVLDAVASDPLGPDPATWRRAASRLREEIRAQVAEVRLLTTWTHP